MPFEQRTRIAELGEDFEVGHKRLFVRPTFFVEDLVYGQVERIQIRVLGIIERLHPFVILFQRTVKPLQPLLKRAFERAREVVIGAQARESLE